jgi:hypothetical protein
MGLKRTKAIDVLNLSYRCNVEDRRWHREWLHKGLPIIATP